MYQQYDLLLKTVTYTLQLLFCYVSPECPIADYSRVRQSAMCYNIFSRTQTPPQYDLLLSTTTYPLQQYDLLLDHASTV